MRRRELDRTVADLLEEHIGLAGKALAVLRRLVEELPEPSGRTEAELARLEEEGDRLAGELIGAAAALRRPPAALAGGGAQLLAQSLDDVVDALAEFGARLSGYGVEGPLEQALGFLDLLEQAVGALGGAVREVRHGRFPEEALAAVADAEQAGDRLEREALASLYVEGIDPILALRWTDLLGHLEEALDRCRRAARLLGALGPGR